MNFLISANTDVGLVKSTNQDSLSAMLLSTPQGKMAFAILCDGMGGLDKGEVASAAVVNAFRGWVTRELPKLCGAPLKDAEIRRQWEQIVVEQNRAINSYGASCGVRLGTTAVVMLLTQNRYYILNVGDSRAYELTTYLRQVTVDHSLVEREVALGHLTAEQAHDDPRRNILLQCIGASDEVYPDMYFGAVKPEMTFMLCSDGFRHEITPEEIYAALCPAALPDQQAMFRNTAALIERNKQRAERDNISALLVRTY